MQLMSASDLEDQEAKSSMLSCTGKRLTSLKGKMEINLKRETGGVRGYELNSLRSVFVSYRTDCVEIVHTFQYNDSVSDNFEREPYSVLIRSREEGGGEGH